MGHHLHEVMPKHRVIWDFTKTQHGRLSEVDHEPGEEKKKGPLNNYVHLMYFNILALLRVSPDAGIK